MRNVKGVAYGPEGQVVSCLFCRIISREEPGAIVLENSKMVAFKTIAPASSNHLLIVPREHRANVHSLSGKEDADLVKEMKKFAVEALREDGCPVDGVDCTLEGTSQFSFHVPPWNSIDHLHLHAIGNRQSMSLAGALKYWEGSFYCWSADEAVENIKKQLAKL
jgi:diadenosine tetraphosphate (Ap4A) HIT family hydrolase